MLSRPTETPGGNLPLTSTSIEVEWRLPLIVPVGRPSARHLALAHFPFVSLRDTYNTTRTYHNLPSISLLSK